jgi:phage-related protein
MSADDKSLVWLHGEVNSPPFSAEARIEAGHLLRMLQKGASLSLPHSRPMPTIGRPVHELRITDRDKPWRIIYRIDSDAIVIVELFAKKTQRTPQSAVRTCKQRLGDYDRIVGGTAHG